MTAKPTRAYRSPLRDEQVRVTRRAVVAAAHDLFVEHGYAGTTVDAVAERAGVSRKTVFNLGGKAVLLRHAFDRALHGDHEQVPVAERPEIRAEQQEHDPGRLLHLWCRRLAVVESRVARLALVMAAAADSDPEVAALDVESDRGRRGGARFLAERLDELGALRDGIDIERATVLTVLACEPLGYQRLVVEAGWSLRDYARWMEQTLTDALLPR